MNFKITEPPKPSNNIYKSQGYENRKDYLDSLAADFGDTVYLLADLLGPSEDFDGLITSLEDADIEGY